MGLKYTSSFDSIRTQSRYIVEIYQDSYDDEPIDFILAATPVVQEWQEDDPLAPIKGSTLTINLTTSGGLSLLDFYSDNDNEFRVKLIEDTTAGTLFDGFIQQDDCSEVQIDFIHTITLTATDNLGTIKDINLNRAAELFGDVISTGAIPCVFVPGSYIVIDWGAGWPVISGQTFTVDTMTFTMVTNLGEIDASPGWCIQVVEEIPALPPGSLTITYREIVSLDGYIPLMTFIKLCLRSTYIQNMELNVYNHITPSDGEIFVATFQTRIFEDVTLLGNTFLKNNEYMSCYDVLEIIMKRFNMSCFQSLGSWWIVRYPDLFLDFEEGETIIDYYNYNSDFVYVDLLQINKSFIIDSSNKVETGLLKSIIRPYRRTLETFNYVQPEDLVCNSQFTDLGPLRQITTGGGFTNKEYELPCWYDYDGNAGPYPDKYIRVVYDADNNEVERYAVVTGTTTLGTLVVQSEDIELNQNDVIDWTFDYRTDVSQPGSVNNVFIVRITDGTTIYYLQDDGSWDTPAGFTYNVPAGQNTNEWHTVTKKSQKIPFNCIFNVFISVTTLNTYDETYYRNLRLTLTYFIGGQLAVNGHSHTASQSRKLNNVNDVEIFIDNSQRSSISGTLFLTSQTGILQDKCTTWEFGSGYNTGFPGVVYNNLGQLATSTYMFQRYKSRTKYNGNLLSIRNVNGVLSNLAIFTNGFAGDLLHNKMLLGSVAIDYKNDSAEFTMWEVFNSETDYADNFVDFTTYLFNILYEFNYLYENN
jgi:hypothetical protein